METILFFSEKNPEMRIIFAYKKRYIYQEYFLNEAGIHIYIYFNLFYLLNFYFIEKYFEFYYVNQEDIYHEFQKNNFFIIKMIKRKLEKN
jgi:hypothetical protein